VSPDDYIDEIVDLWDERPVPPELVRLAKEAVERFPDIAEFRVRLVRAVILADRYPPSEAEPTDGSPQRSDTVDIGIPEFLTHLTLAVQLDDSDPEAFEELGYIYDIYIDDMIQAEYYFQQAIERGGSEWCYSGLARVLEQMGRREDAFRVLDTCPFQWAECVIDMRGEIERGEWDFRWCESNDLMEDDE
jgi:hypothetical protein